MQPFYADDLAFIHDAGFDGFANGIAPGILQHLRSAKVNDGLVVDLGCGSGIWAKHLLDAGYQVLGADLSPAMIALARQQAPRADFRVESWHTLALPACRAITALGEVLCYRPNGPRMLPPLFRRAARALSPGGLFIFDLAEVGLDRNRPPTGREGKDWACLVRFEYDDARHQLIRHITTFREVNTTYRRHEETHRVQLYHRRAVLEMLREAGFQVRMVRRYGDYALLPGRIGFIARRVGTA